MWQVLRLSHAGTPCVEASERKLPDVGFYFQVKEGNQKISMQTSF